MTSRIRDLTLKYDWYVYHGNIMLKEPFNSNPPPSETVRNTKFVI